MSTSKKVFKKVEPILYLLPAGILLFLFSYFPFIKSFIGSFFIMDAQGTFNSFVGLENYIRILTDEKFLKAILNTLMFVIVSVPLSILTGLFFALLVNEKRRASSIYIAVFAMPMAMSMAVIAMIFQLGLNPTLGIINGVFDLDINWLSNEMTALPALIVIQTWLNIGFSFLFLLAAVRGIPQEILESAHIDGASGFHKLRKVIIPLISPTLFFLLISTMALVIMTSALTLILTEGGPNGSTETIVSYIYKYGIQNMDYNRGNAATIVGFLIALAFVLVSFIYEKKGVNYD